MVNSDFEIIQNLRSRDKRIKNQTIEMVYRTYYPVIRTMVISNSGNEEEAEDVFQDSLIVLYSKARDMNFELSSNLKTYLYSVARNLWLNKLKLRNRMNIKPMDDELKELEGDLPDVLEASPRQKRIQREFPNIGKGCQEILYNYYYNRMSMHAIAEEMGLANDQVAKNKKSRCLKKLKELIFRKT